MMLTRIRSFFRRAVKRYRYFLLMIPAVLVLLLLIWFLFVREKPGDHLHAVPLPDVTGAWADSVFTLLEPEDKFSLLMLYPAGFPEWDSAISVLPSYAGGVFVDFDADTISGSTGHVVDRVPFSSIPLLRISGSTTTIPEPFSLSLGLETLLSIRSDSLVQKYLLHYLARAAQHGLTVVPYPLLPDRPHTLKMPDTLTLLRHALLLTDFVGRVMEAGLIPALHLPGVAIPGSSSLRLPDSLLAPYAGRFLSGSLPLVTIDSLPVLPEGFERLGDFLMARYGFTGLIVHRRPVSGLESLLRLLSSGVDMVAASSGNGALQRAFADRYRRDRSVRVITDRAVMRVLLYKEWLLMQDEITPNVPVDLYDTVSTMHLQLSLNRAAIVRLNDAHGLLPLPVGSPITLHIPADDPFDALVNTSKLFTDIRVVRYRARAAVLSDRGGGIHVVVLRSGSDRALPPFARGLKGERHLLLHFGPVDSLAALHADAAVVHVSRSDDATRRQVANGIFGGIALDGVLPWDISERLPSTMGMPGLVPVRLNHTVPEEAGLSGAILQRIDSIVIEAIRNGAFPGCQVFVAWRGNVVYNKSFGHHTYEELIPVMHDHLFDVASVTKVAATTLAAMRMTGAGKIHLDRPLGSYFTHTTIPPEPVADVDLTFMDSLQYRRPVEYVVFKIPIRLLLTHRSGLPAALPLGRYVRNTERALPGFRTTDLFSPVSLPGHADIRVAEGMHLFNHNIDTLWLQAKGMGVNPLRNYVYSDANMVFLQQAIDSVNQKGMDKYLREEVYDRLGLRYCLFNPTDHFEKSVIVPTANDLRWRRQMVHGTVHDPTAALFGGVAGNAGLFSNALDLGIIGQMLLNRGSYGGAEIFDTALVQMFVTRQPGGHRALGFDMPSSERSVVAPGASQNSFGHIGFTGTCIWVDPDHELVYVFLSNRIHPNTENQKINFLKVRQRVHQVAYDAISASEQNIREREAQK